MLVSIFHVSFIVLKKERARRVSKCLVVPVLLGAYLAGGGNKFLLPVFALVLGWFGDVLLLRIEKKINFMLGLASFLLGHLCYTLTFINILGFSVSDDAPGKISIPAAALFTVPAIVLGALVFRLVKPAKEMYVPVIVYMIVLELMTLFGFQVFLFYPGFAGFLILSGCLCFMISDTILAYHIFRKQTLLGAILIMVFYILAQTEIILGLLRL